MKETYKPYDTEELVDYYFFRPIASQIVNAVHETKITPNHLTFIAFLFGAFSGFFLYFSQPLYLFLGIFFLLTYTVFDCSDGQLARKRGGGGTFGRALDGFADYMVFLSIYLFSILKFQDISFLRLEGAEPYGTVIWVLGVIAMASHSIQCSCFDYYQNEYVAYVIKKSRNEGTTSIGIKKEIDSLDEANGKWFVRTVLRGIYFFTIAQETVNKKKTLLEQNAITEDISEIYRKQNRILLRLWSVLGASAHVIYIVVFSLFDRIDLFFLFEIILLNIYMLALMIYQKRALRSVEEQVHSDPSKL